MVMLLNVFIMYAVLRPAISISLITIFILFQSICTTVPLPCYYYSQINKRTYMDSIGDYDSLNDKMIENFMWMIKDALMSTLH